MQIRHQTQGLINPDGIRLYQQSWLPSQPIAAVMLVHGYAEHSGRYAHLAHYLAEQGFAVHAVDLRGHGRSDGARCSVRQFADYVSDLETCWAAWPEPAFLLGHSMGSLVALLFLLQAQSSQIRGLITSGTALAIDQDTPRFKVQLVTALSRWFPRLPVQRLESQLISCHAQLVQAYDRDPLIYHGGIPARTAVEMFRAVRQIRPRLSELNLPTLILHGSADRVAPLTGSQLLYEQIASRDKSFQIYSDLGHELVNEPERDRVLQDMSDWLRQRGVRPNSASQ